MKTHCKTNRIELQGPGRQILTADFNGGHLSSDAGVLVLQQLDQKLGILRRFAECFVDARDPGRVEHSLEELLRQRVFGLTLGYEDLNDHDQLRVDPLLASAVGKRDATGAERKHARHQGAALAAKSTLNRVEFALHAEAAEDRYHRIAADPDAIEEFFVEVFLDSFEEVPERIVLDFDATDNPLHGEQEGRFFHGYYREYCYLPLYVFCGRHILCAKLRPSNIDASAGSLEVLQSLVEQIRQRWPEVEILVRADSAFARDGLMSWCESNGVDYLFGLARNSRLEAEIEAPFLALEAEREALGVTGSTRRFAELRYRTLKTWSRERRVVAKAEITAQGRNPRFVVTSLSQSLEAREVYEDLYCARGESENRIKEQQLDLFSRRTSGHLMRVNQMRLWYSAIAYLLINELRQRVLEGTDLANARCQTIRLKLFKIAAHIRVTVRRIWISMASSYPWQDRFRQILHRLEQLHPAPG